MEDEMAFPKELMKAVKETLGQIATQLPMSGEEQARRMGCSQGERFRLFHRPEVDLSELSAKDICTALKLDWDLVYAIAKQRWQHNEQQEAAVKTVVRGWTRD